MTKIDLTQVKDLSATDYLVIGLARCFLKQDGELCPVDILEPVPSATLETLLKGIPTSYQLAYATTLGEALADALSIDLPQLGDRLKGTQLCDDFDQRALAAARTYRAHPESQSYIALGTVYSEFNYSVERKRLLNSQRIVRAEDNVKQHEYTHKVL